MFQAEYEQKCGKCPYRISKGQWVTGPSGAYRHEQCPGLTVPSRQFKASPAGTQADLVRRWFHTNFESPHDLPFCSAEGGYEFIWGGPYSAEDALDGIAGLISDELRENLESELSDEECEWSWIPEKGDYVE